MPGIGETLTHKVGPLPVWVWTGVGVAGLALYLSKKKKASTASQAQASGGSSNLGAVPISNLTTQAQPMPFQMGDVFVTVPQNIQQNNDEDAPPPPIKKKPPPADDIDTPPPPHPPPPTQPQRYTVKRGDTLWGIAKQFYGPNNGPQWTRIYQANKGQIKNPNLIYPGQVFVIPPGAFQNQWGRG